MSTCTRCGAEVPPDAQYCPKCGSSVEMRDWREIKHEQKEARRARRHMLWSSPEWGLVNTLLVGLLVIYFGGIFYLAMWNRIGMVSWANFWAWLIVGLGLFLLIRSLARAAIAGGYYWYSGFAGGLILFAIGVAALTISLTGWSRYLWAAFIVVGGVLIIVAGIVNYLLAKR